MNKDWHIQLMDKLSGDLSEKEAAEFESKTNQNNELKDEYTFFNSAWDDLDELRVDSPSESLSLEFYKKLDQKIDKQENSFQNKMRQIGVAIFKSKHLVRNMSLGMLFLSVGFILGGKLNKKTITVNQTTVHTNPETLQNSNLNVGFIPSTQRIQHVSQITKSSTDKDLALVELKKVLANESNTNVKLAALRQIDQHYADDKGLKTFLSQQIEVERSPLVQVELLNLLMDFHQPKETIQTMESMLNSKQLNPIIQEKIRNDLPVLRASYVK